MKQRVKKQNNFLFTSFYKNTWINIDFSLNVQ